MAFQYPQFASPFQQPQPMLANPHLQMPAMMQVAQPKPFVPLGLTPQQSILGNPPPAGRGAINPFLNAAVLRNSVPARVPVKPHIQPAFNRKPMPLPMPIAIPTANPVNTGELFGKLAKLIPELSKPEKSTANARLFEDLLHRGLSKQTAPNFYAALETLAANIGKEEFNQRALWRVFEYAFLNKHLFSANATHQENINKWKKEADALSSGGTAKPEGRKRDLTETPATGAGANNAKRARVTPYRNYNVVDVGQQVDVLQQELVAVKEELKALREQHKRELDFLYQHLGVTPPAPPSPEPEPELEPEPQLVETPHEPAQPAADGTAETANEKGEVEMAEPVANTNEEAVDVNQTSEV